MAASATRFAQCILEGPDAAAFLQGYATADVDALLPGRALPTALCNLKGRVVASGWVAGTPTALRIIVHADMAAPLRAFLGKYLPFAQSTLRVQRGALAVGAHPDAAPLPPANVAARCDAPADCGHDALAEGCVAAGFAIVEPATSERFLPQMLGLTAHGAVSFAKGCYLGQEVVARAEHLGAVKRRLRRYRYLDAGASAPAIGAEVLDGGARAVGAVVAVGGASLLAVSHTEDSPLAAGGRRIALDVL